MRPGHGSIQTNHVAHSNRVVPSDRVGHVGQDHDPPEAWPPGVSLMIDPIGHIRECG